MEESLKHGKDAVIAHLDAAEVLQPGVGALDFPALAVSAQLAFVLEAAVADVVSVGNNQLRTLPFQSRPQRIGVIAPIGNDAPEMRARASPPGPRHPHLAERALREPALGNLRGRKLRSDRYAPAVDHHHALRTFPATRFADCRAPFFAVIKVASRKASSQSSNRRSSSRESSFRHAACQTSCSSHLRNRRQQVDPSGYASGTSRHRAPVRSTHRIPSRHPRFEAQGRPRPSLRRFGSGNSGHNISHCSSLNNTCRLFCLMAEDQQTTASHVSPSLEAAPIYTTSSRNSSITGSRTKSRGVCKGAMVPIASFSTAARSEVASRRS